MKTKKIKETKVRENTNWSSQEKAKKNKKNSLLTRHKKVKAKRRKRATTVCGK